MTDVAPAGGNDLQAAAIANALNPPAKGEKRPPHAVLHVQFFRDYHYKWHRLAEKGYSRLITFLIFAVVFLWVVGSQHQTKLLNDNCNAWQYKMMQLNPGGKITKTAALWAFLSGTLNIGPVSIGLTDLLFGERTPVVDWDDQGLQHNEKKYPKLNFEELKKDLEEDAGHKAEDDMPIANPKEFLKKTLGATGTEFVQIDDANENAMAKTSLDFQLEDYSTLSGFDYLIGGFTMTVRRKQVYECYTNTPCWSEKEMTGGNIDLHYRGKVLHVPWNDMYKGYTVYIPGKSAAVAQQLVLFYKEAGLFSQNTYRMQTNWMSFNPNQQKAVSLVMWGVDVSSAGQWLTDFYPTTIPYYLYPLDSFDWYVRVVMEVLAVFLAIYKGMPVIMHVIDDNTLLGASTNIPIDKTGIPMVKTAIIMYTLILIDVIMWGLICSKNSNLPAFGSKELNAIFASDPLTDYLSKGNTVDDILAHNEEGFEYLQALYQDKLQPFWGAYADFATWWEAYCFFTAATAFFMLARTFEYLAFQKKLSVITDTVAGIGDGMLHLMILWVLVVAGFACICQFCFGHLDVSFMTFADGFGALVGFCFGVHGIGSTDYDWAFPRAKFPGINDIPSVNAYILPVMIMVVFKIIVLMVLFKAIIVLLFDAYKDCSGPHRKRARSITVEISHLVWYRFEWLKHKIFKTPFASIADLGVAVHWYETQGSFDSHHMEKNELKNALQACPFALLEGGVKRPLRDDDIHWACHNYGMKHSQSLWNKLKNPHTHPAEIVADAEAVEIFRKYDSEYVGHITVADLPDMLHELKYYSIYNDLEFLKLLVLEYDENEDNCFEEVEFLQLINDPVLRALKKERLKKEKKYGAGAGQGAEEDDDDDVDDDDDDEEEAAPAPVQKAAPAPSKKAPAAPAPKANAGGNINEEQLLHAIRKSNLKEPLLDAIKKAKNQ